MEPVRVMMWIDVCVCLPLTILVICCVCCAVRRDEVPVIYYTNLLISNLIQMCILIVWVAKVRDDQTQVICQVFFFFGMLASLYFKMCIALERYFFITCPLLDCVRQTNVFVLVCVLVWTLCIIIAPVAILLEQFVSIHLFALFPAPVFIFCSAGTFKALPAATSVLTEEKRRIVGIIILLLLNYFMIMLAAITQLCFDPQPFVRDIIFILLLLSPLVDLILSVFMWNGPIDKLLACLWHCRMESTAADVASEHL